MFLNGHIYLSCTGPFFLIGIFGLNQPESWPEGNGRNFSGPEKKNRSALICGSEIRLMATRNPKAKHRLDGAKTLEKIVGSQLVFCAGFLNEPSTPYVGMVKTPTVAGLGVGLPPDLGYPGAWDDSKLLLRQLVEISL